MGHHACSGAFQLQFLLSVSGAPPPMLYPLPLHASMSSTGRVKSEGLDEGWRETTGKAFFPIEHIPNISLCYIHNVHMLVIELPTREDTGRTPVTDDVIIHA